MLESKKVEDYDLLGDRAYRLARLKNTGVKIPESFVISSIAFDDFIILNGIGDKITEYLSKVRVFDKTSASNASGFITNILMSNSLPNVVEKSILYGYSLLGNDFSSPFVNLEYSHLIPDQFLPQFIKTLKSGEIRGEEKLLEKVRFFWAGLFATESIECRSNNYYNGPISTGLIVRKVTRSELSGAVKSIADINRQNLVGITALYGLPFSSSTPEDQSDNYLVDISSNEIVEKRISPQQFMNVRKGSKTSDMDSSLIRVEISNLWQTKQKVTDSMINEIKELGLFLEKFYGGPIEAKWEIENSVVYITEVNYAEIPKVKIKPPDINFKKKKSNEKPKEIVQKKKIDLDEIAKEIKSFQRIENEKRDLNTEVDFISNKKSSKESIDYSRFYQDTTDFYYNLNFVSLGLLETALEEGYGGFLDLSTRIEELGFLPEDFSSNSEKINQIIQSLAIDISISAKNFQEGKFIYKISSFSSKKYAQISRNKIEINEDERLILKPQSLSVELEAIKRAKEIYECPDFSICIPGVRNISNLKSIFSMLKVQGFSRNKNTRIYAEVVYPSFVFDIKNLYPEIIDGIVIDYEKLKYLLFGKSNLSKDEDLNFKSILRNDLIAYAQKLKLEIIFNIYDMDQAESDDILEEFENNGIILPQKI